MDTLPDHLEVDSHPSDADSTLGSSLHTTTTSLSPSVQTFHHENGRRYHSFDPTAYFLPNDSIETARLDLQHYTWKLTFNNLPGRIPITDTIKRVLDVGTGTGIWAIELAEQYPGVQVVGTDLSPIQPEWVPPNCSFVVDNAEAHWEFQQPFDYIHARMLTAGMHDWPRFFRQVYDNLTPGGWLEANEVQFPPCHAEQDLATPLGDRPSPFLQWGEYCYTAAGRAGIDARASERFKEYLEGAGFVNVSRVDVQWPVKPWAKGKRNKVIGRLVYENTQTAVQGIALGLFTRALGWSKEEVEGFCEECLRDVDAKDSRFYYPMVLHTAQKPESA